MPFTNDEKNRLRDYSKKMTGGRELPEEARVMIEQQQREATEPQGTLMKTIDYLNRPLYASAGFANAIVQGKGIKEASSAAVKGFVGQERIFYSDVLNSAGIKNKYVRAIGGFSLDVLLDPVTYLTFGVGSGAKLGITTLSKGGRTLLNRTLTRQLPKLTKLNLAKGMSKEIAEKMARETIEEATLRMALKEPGKYVAKSAVRILGKEIPVVSDVWQTSTKMIGKRLGKKIAPITEKVYQKGPLRWAGEAFIGDDFIIKHAKNLTPLQKNLITLYRQQAKSRILLGGELATQKALQMAKEVPNLADRKLIANAIEQAAKKKVKLSSLLPKHLVSKADDLERFIFKEITEPEAKKGLIQSFKQGYVPHYYKQKLAGMMSKDIPHPIIARNKSGRVRIFETMAEAVDAGWQPIEDYAVSVGLRNAYSKRVIAIDDYVQRMLSTTGTPLNKKSVAWKQMLKTKKVPAGMGIYMPRGGARFYPLYNSAKTKVNQVGNAEAIKKLFQVEGTGGFFGGELLKELRLTPVQTAFKLSDDIPVYLLPKDIADMMNAISPFAREKTAHIFAKFSDDVMNVWKTSVTSWWPGFHSRNAMSNVWLSWLGGLQNPKRFVEAARLQWFDYMTSRGKDVADFTVTLGGKKYKASQLIKMGKETGVLNRGWFGAEMGRSLEKNIMLQTGIRPRLTGKQKGLQLARDIFIEKPRGAGTAVENNARFALFLDQIGKGFDVDSAARHTKKFLFDYGELTKFEKKYMKRIFPFYTWIRKNIPLEVEQLIKQPGKFAAVGKIKAEIESVSERPDEEYLPDWMREKELFIRLPYESPDKPFYVNFDFAFQDLARLNFAGKPLDTLREWYAYLRPDLKAITEIATNYNVFFGRNIVDPDLPEEIRFRELVKEELLNNMRITGYWRRFEKKDIPIINKIIDFSLGLRAYPFDESTSKYYYYQRKQREQRALQKLKLKKKKK